MSYARKCLCCSRERERRHFFHVSDGDVMRLSLVCQDCVNGRTPERFLRSAQVRAPVVASDGLWRGPVMRGPMVARL